MTPAETAAVILMGIGSVGQIMAVCLELKYREPKYKIMMKIFPWIFAVGAVLFSLN